MNPRKRQCVLFEYKLPHLPLDMLGLVSKFLCNGEENGSFPHVLQTTISHQNVRRSATLDMYFQCVQNMGAKEYHSMETDDQGEFNI